VTVAGNRELQSDVAFKFHAIFFIESSTNQSYFLSASYGIARDFNSNILYVADTFNSRVMSYRSGSMLGTTAAGTGVAGSNTTELSIPYDVYYDSPTNSLFISNMGMNTVVRWVVGASNWELVAGTHGLGGSSSTQLFVPIGITLDPMGNLYVADAYNHRIQFFEAGQSNGLTIAGVNQTSGFNADQLNTPLYVALDSQLNLYVSDTSNHRVQKFQRY